MVDLIFPSSLHEACRILTEAGGAARVIAGGVSLMVLIRHQLYFPTCLVSLKRLPGLDEIRYDATEGLRIGALVTHRQVETSSTVQRYYPELAQCIHHVGNMRVRNMGTLVGDLCQADNHSDPAPLLGVMGAKIKARSLSGERLLSMREFHVDIYETGLRHEEIVTEIVIPPPSELARAAYLRFSGNSRADWPCVGVAGSLIEENGRCVQLKISVGSLTHVPMAFDEETERLKGKKLTPSVAKDLARSCAAKINPIGDLRGSEWYKRQIAEVYIRRTIAALMR